MSCRRRPTLAELSARQELEAAKLLVIMADDLRYIAEHEGDDYALGLADRLERKATSILERAITDESSD